MRSPLLLTWFVLMNEVLGESSSTRPPVLIVSIPEDTAGPKDQPVLLLSFAWLQIS